MVTATFCQSGAVLLKAGSGHSAELDGSLLVGSDEALDIWIVDAESTINAITRFNFTDAYGTLNIDLREILRSVASNLAAIDAIAYDFDGYSSRTVAEDKINLLNSSAQRGLSILRDKKVQDFIKDAT